MRSDPVRLDLRWGQRRVSPQSGGHLCGGRHHSHARRFSGEQGQAIAMVAAIVVGIVILVGVVLTVTLNTIDQGASDVSQEAAFTAAQSGITDYLGTIRSNPAFPDQDAGNSAYAAFGNKTGTPTWEPVPGSDQECFWFRTDSLDPSVVITVTGRDGPPSTDCAFSAGARYVYETIGATLGLQTYVQITGNPDMDDLNGPDGDSDDASASYPNGDQVVDTWIEQTQCPTGTVDSDGQETTTSQCP